MAKSKKVLFAVDTSQRTLKEWMKAIAVLIVGLAVLLFGAALMILSELGSDSFAVFNQGLSQTFDLSLGTVQFIFNFILLVILLFTSKGYVKPGTIVTTFLAGPFIDFYIWLLADYINITSSIYLRLASVFIGCIILSIGISIIINSEAGAGANDIVTMVLSDKIKKIEFKWIKVIYDFILVTIGFFLGGTIGIGTFIAVILLGPFIQFWLPRTGIVIKHIMAEN